jgi:UDP-N-acetylglucosamine 1-carboxyvinyltransferase
MQAVTQKLAEIGADVRVDDDGVRVIVPEGRVLRGTTIKASPHPGFPTDMQPLMAAVLTLAQGTSVITETVYERRFKYIDEMSRMGADIKNEGNAALISGVARLTGAPVAGSDLRATAALVIAGLAAEGQSEISGIGYLDRGYEKFVEKMRGVGAKIRRDEASVVRAERVV